MNEDFHNSMMMYGIFIFAIMLVTVIVLTMLDCGRIFPSLVEYIHSHPF